MRTNIDIPLLNQEDFITAYAQQRPFRKGGNRLQIVQEDGKIIVHNYGHGGAGVSLAPGSGIIATYLIGHHLRKSPNSKVAVLGSGIIGLFNCYQLKKRYPDLTITVYADRIPQFGEKNNDKLITSQVAPGFWLPYHYGSNDTELHKLLSAFSLKEYSELAKRYEYKTAIKEVQMIDISDKDLNQDYFSVLTEQLKPSFKQREIIINNSVNVKCKTFSTVKIDMQPFLNTLINQLKENQVKFVQKKLEKGLKNIDQQIVFNCTGLGSKTIFGDDALSGIKGHLLEFRNPNPLKYDCFIRANLGTQAVNYYMHNTRIILGLTREAVDDCKVDAVQVANLLKAHRGILEKFGIKVPSPKL